MGSAVSIGISKESRRDPALFFMGRRSRKMGDYDHEKHKNRSGKNFFLSFLFFIILQCCVIKITIVIQNSERTAWGTGVIFKEL